MKAGLLEVEGRTIGVLRIPIFEAQGFPDICEKLTAEEGLKPGSPCDDACADRLGRRAGALFVAEMRSQLAAVVAERPDILLLDVAENGGGDDSSMVLAALVADTRLRKPRAAMVEGPALERELASRQTDIHAAVASATGPLRIALKRFDDALTAARVAALRPCDRAPLWQGQPIACTGLAPEPVYEGPLPPVGAKPADWVEVAAPITRFPPVTTIWRGPLIVLVDGNSASSTELLAAMLQDARMAVILGSPTFGAGCGHMTDARPVVLANSGATVSMPDCVRYRADGTNEAAGVRPDVSIGFRAYDTPRQRVDLLTRALPQAVERATEMARR